MIKRRTSQAVWPLAGFIALTLAGCGNREREFDACGQIKATEITVSAESNGRILNLNIEEGDRVKGGTQVGAIDSVQTWLQRRELIARKTEAETRLVDIGTQLKPQKEELENIELNLGRFRDLKKNDAGTQKQLDDAATQSAVAKAQLRAGKQNYEKQNASINRQIDIYDVQIAQKTDLLNKCRITVPTNGTILTKYTEPGEMVTTGTPLFKMADMNNLYVKAYFTTEQLAGLKIGDKVNVMPEDGSEKPKTIEGVVRWIAEEAEFTPKNIQTKDERADLVYAVKITVPNDGSLKLGMYAYVVLK